MKRGLLMIGGMALALLAFSPKAEAEIIERELGTDSNGNSVKGHVFQAGRGFGRSSRRSSSLPVRRAPRRRSVSRGITTGYHYSHFYVPVGAFYWRSPISFCRIPMRHFHGSSLSVRIYR